MTVSIYDVANEIIRLGESSPDFVYSSEEDIGVCFYLRPDGSGGCIVGTALLNLGIGIDLMKSADARMLNKDAVGAEDLLDDIFGKDNDKKLAFLIGEVQADQDVAIPWGEAINHLKK